MKEKKEELAEQIPGTPIKEEIVPELSEKNKKRPETSGTGRKP